MDNKRNFRKIVLNVTILTDDPDFSAYEVVNDNFGNVVVDAVETEDKALTGKEMADALCAARSTPEFFDLDDEGDSIDD